MTLSNYDWKNAAYDESFRVIYIEEAGHWQYFKGEEITSAPAYSTEQEAWRAVRENHDIGRRDDEPNET